VASLFPVFFFRCAPSQINWKKCRPATEPNWVKSTKAQDIFPLSFPEFDFLVYWKQYYTSFISELSEERLCVQYVFRFRPILLCRLGFMTGSIIQRLYIVRSTELHLCSLCTIKLWDLNRASQIFRKCRSHLQMAGAWRMTWSNFRAENPQFLSDLWTSLLSEAFCSMHVNWYTFLYPRKKVE